MVPIYAFIRERNDETPVMVSFHRPGEYLIDDSPGGNKSVPLRPASTTQTRRKFFQSNGNRNGSTSLWVDCADEIVRLLAVDQPRRDSSNAPSSSPEQLALTLSSTSANTLPPQYFNSGGGHAAPFVGTFM